jgi:hypothetical protein
MWRETAMTLFKVLFQYMPTKAEDKQKIQSISYGSHGNLPQGIYLNPGHPEYKIGWLITRKWLSVPTYPFKMGNKDFHASSSHASDYENGCRLRYDIVIWHATYLLVFLRKLLLLSLGRKRTTLVMEEAGSFEHWYLLDCTAPHPRRQ